MKIIRESGKLLSVGNGVRIPLHVVVGKRLLSLSDVCSDYISGKFVLCEIDEDEEARIRRASSDFFLSHVMYRDELEEYLKKKNDEREQRNFSDLYDMINEHDDHLSMVERLLTTMINHVASLHDTFTKPRHVTLKEVATYLPDYKLTTLRNILSKNRKLDLNTRVWHSWLKIDEFQLHFTKPEHSKTWLSDRFDFIPEKSKAQSYDFRRKMANRGKV